MIGFMSYNNITKTIQTKSEWLSNNGFNVEGTTFCVIGANTFSIKEELKQLGYKFNPLLKWHSPLPTELPSGFRLIEIPFDTYYSFNEELGIACPRNDAEEKLVEFFYRAEGRGLPEYYGAVGYRFYRKPAKFISKRNFEGYYGNSNVYTFTIDNANLVWITTKTINNADIGQTIHLTGTIKKQEKYKGEKVTYLTRCIIEN